MTPTLQDVAYLLGLPIVREAVGARVVAASWNDDLETRFALVDHVEEAGPINPHPRAVGPLKIWFLQYVFIAYLSLIVTIHMLHCQLKPLILIVYAVYPVGCGCRRVQCDQIAGGVTTLVVWLYHVQQHSWQLGR